MYIEIIISNHYGYFVTIAYSFLLIAPTQFCTEQGNGKFNIHRGAEITGLIRMFKTKRKSRRKNKFKYQDNQLPCKETMDFLCKCTKFDEEEIGEWYR